MLAYPIDQVVRLNQLIAEGKISKVEGTENLYRSVLMPGMLLFKTVRRSDLSKGVGAAIFHGTPVKMSLCINPSDPCGALDSLCDGALIAYGFVAKSADSVLLPMGTGRVTGHDSGMFGGSGTASRVRYEYKSMWVDTKEPNGGTVSLVMGVLTGATSGLLLASTGGASYDRLYSANYPTSALGGSFEMEQRRGVLSTGYTRTIKSILETYKTVLFDGIPSSALGTAQELLDSMVATDWFASQAKYLFGLSQIMTMSNGVWQRGAYGDEVVHTQSLFNSADVVVDGNLQLPLSWTFLPDGADAYSGEWKPSPGYAYVQTSETPKGVLAASYGTSIPHKVYGTSVITKSANPLDLETWRKAMFLADDIDYVKTVNGEVEHDAVISPDASIFPENPALGTPDEQTDRITAKFKVDRDVLKKEWDAKAVNGICTEVQRRNLAAFVSEFWFELDKRIRS